MCLLGRKCGHDKGFRRQAGKNYRRWPISQHFADYLNGGHKEKLKFPENLRRKGVHFTYYYKIKTVCDKATN